MKVLYHIRPKGAKATQGNPRQPKAPVLPFPFLSIHSSFVKHNGRNYTVLNRLAMLRPEEEQHKIRSKKAKQKKKTIQ